MATRYIDGMTKHDFITSCFAKASEINSDWEQEVFSMPMGTAKDSLDSLVWKSSADTYGLQLSVSGSLFFSSALQLTPYQIEVNSRDMSNKIMLGLSKYMPWPYAITYSTRNMESKYIISMYSSEVAVWAAMFDNNIERILESYNSR